MIKQGQIPFAAAAIFLILAAFLYATHTILSPILAGLALLFLLSGFKNDLFARRLTVVVTVILLVWLLIRAQTMLFPFILAFAIAYIFDPVADFFEARKIPRTLATIMLLVLTFGLVFLIGIITVSYTHLTLPTN